MHTRVYIRSRSGSRDGIALVTVLAFIVLLTILIISFISFTRLNRLATGSYSRSIQAQEVALGGMQDILSDLREEIVAGSTAYTQGGTTIYVPCTNLTAFPARIGYPSSSYTNDPSATSAYLSPTLIRVSRATGNTGDAFFSQFLSSPYTNSMASLPGGLPILNRASAASTAASSIDGRAIPAARWNKTYLLAPTIATIPVPFTNAPPDWVYVTRTGSRVCSTSPINEFKTTPSLYYSKNVATDYYNGSTLQPGVNPPVSPVIGRYAFVMYDEGALLDANVAGYTSASAYINASAKTNIVSYPPDPTTGMTQAINGKSFESCADLTQLPGLTGAQSTVDAFVNWRNASAGGTGNGYLLALIGYAQNGFLTFKTGDSPLLSRQDLINYFANIDPNINSTTATFSKALPYLGTFSRAVNAPTWTPVTPAGSTIDYAGNAEKSTFFNPAEGKNGTTNDPNPNRNLSNLRWPSSAQIKHYKDDGTLAQYTDSTGAAQAYYTVVADEPMLKTRFSLARLAWLTYSGPASGKATAIQDCFGLSWSTDGQGNPAWLYNHGNSSRILTLAEVAAAGREPDFFELLKAAILSGSLGKNPGKICSELDYNIDPTSNPPGIPCGAIGVAGYDFEDHMAFPDMQILAIGANIIDQFDADSYPTEIFIDPSLNGTAEQGPVNMVFGQENLPSLTRIYNIYYEQTSGQLDSWFQPELWNINQMPTSTSLPASRPTKFRITVYGNGILHWTEQSQNRQGDSGATAYTGAPSHIYFSDAGGSASPFYANPVILTISNAGTTSPTDSGNIWYSSVYQTSPSNSFVALHAGTARYGTGTTAVDDVISAGGAQLQAWLKPNPLITFALEYSSDGGSTYRPYNYMSRLSAYASTGSSLPVVVGNRTDPTNYIIHFVYSGYVDSTVTPSQQMFYSHSDPRTDRFSAQQSEQGHSGLTPSGNYQGAHWNPNFTLAPVGYVAYMGDPTYKVSPQRSPPRPDVAAANAGKAIPPNGFYYNPGCVSSGWNYLYNDSFDVGDWVENNANSPSTCWAYYSDPDGVVRPGDGYRVTYSTTLSATTGDGNMLFPNPVPSGPPTNNTQNGRRPIILNRPFRSVGELGYAFRDDPYKSIDFFSPLSADAALLDVFSITDEPAIAAGQVNPSAAPAPVLAAILAGGAKKEIDPTLALTPTTASTVAQAISTQILNPANGPLLNRANLVTSLSDAINSALASANDRGDKPFAEAPIRALTDVSNTRTWNLLIDIIAQSGQMSSTAQTLNDFVVQGERRYWLHIAIDRYTGKIIDQQLEPVYE